MIEHENGLQNEDTNLSNRYWRPKWLFVRINGEAELPSFLFKLSSDFTNCEVLRAKTDLLLKKKHKRFLPSSDFSRGPVEPKADPIMLREARSVLCRQSWKNKDRWPKNWKPNCFLFSIQTAVSVRGKRESNFNLLDCWWFFLLMYSLAHNCPLRSVHRSGPGSADRWHSCWR